MRLRRAEDGHHRVADVLLDPSAVLLEGGPRELDERSERGPRVLGVAAGDEGRRADQVGEHDRRELALGAGRGRERRTA